MWVFTLQGVSPRPSEAVLRASHFGSKIWKTQLEVTFSRSHNEVEQSHTSLLGFVGGLVPFTATGKTTRKQDLPTGIGLAGGAAGMILQRQVILDVHRARDIQNLIRASQPPQVGLHPTLQIRKLRRRTCNGLAKIRQD